MTDKQTIVEVKQLLDTVMRYADSPNRGRDAGVKYRNVNLGTSQYPLTVDKDEFFGFLLKLKGVADQAEWGMAGRCVFFPLFSQPLIMQHPALVELTCREHHLGEALPEPIHGFTVVFTRAVPTYFGRNAQTTEVVPIVATWSSGETTLDSFALAIVEFPHTRL